MALQASSQDVFFSATDQQKGAHQGVSGRVKNLINGQSTRFQHATPTMPARFLLEPRKGFASLPLDCRDTLGTVIASPAWVNCDYLNTIGDSLVTIDGRKPRVWNGYDYWIDYSASTSIITNKLHEDTIVGGYGTIQGQDSVTIGHVKAVAYAQNQTSIYLGFRTAPGIASDPRRATDSAGGWIVPPVLVANVGASAAAKVRSDGTNFWLFYSDTVLMHVAVYDTTGTRLATTSFSKLDFSKSPGFWDITVNPFDPTRLVFVQPAALTTNPATDVNVQFWSLWYTGGVLHTDNNVDNTIKCNGLCSFIRNDRSADANCYLVTTGPGTANQHVYLYRVNVSSIPFAQSHEYSVIDSLVPVDAATGYVENNVTFTAHPVVGFLETSNAVGPQYDPQSRAIVTYNLTDASVTEVRRSCGLALTTQTFRFGGDYIHGAYYQSGSGLAADQSVITPVITAGDFFTGSGTQSIKAQSGDYTSGSQKPCNLSSSNGGIEVTGSTASIGIAAGDTVAAFTATGTVPAGITAGTALLEWTLAGYASGGGYGSNLVVLGSSGVTGADGTWDVYGSNPATHKFYTATNKAGGGSSAGGAGLTPGTFGTAGLFQSLSLSAYRTDLNANAFGVQLQPFFYNGRLTVTGTRGTENVSNALILRVSVGTDPINAGNPNTTIWVQTSTQIGNSTAVGQAVLVPVNPDRWHFASFISGSIPVGATLTTSGDTVNASNNGEFPITAVAPPLTFDTGGQTGLISEVFQAPFINASVTLGADTLPFTFFLQGLAAQLAVNPFRFIGALLKFTSSNASATGTYRITSYNASLDGTVYTERVVEADDVSAQSLVNGVDSVIVYLPVSVQAPFQPTYFLIEALGNRAFVGMFDRLAAYNAYRLGGVNTVYGHLTSVSIENDGTAFVLPTVQERVNSESDNGQVANATTVGLKSWVISRDNGNGVAALIPGTAAVSFEKSSFPEDGFALAPEAPWLVGIDSAPGGQIGLTPKGQYTYTIIIESQDSQGNRVFSPPSPPLTVGLTGTNNRITLGGDLPVPLSSVGQPIAGFLGVSNRQTTISVERTSYVNGTPTVTRYKVTSDLKPNGVAPISSSNNSGFTFSSDHRTWAYVDQNPDQDIQLNEQDYSQSSLPRFGAPCFSDACIWNDRYWLITSDGSLKFSTALTDGVRPNFFPGFSVAPPATDRPVAVRPMQQFLVVLCERSVWYLPATALPTAALVDVGQVTIPALIPLPFTNGCTGQAVTSAAGTIYASTAGLAWNVTRGLSNDYMSQEVIDDYNSMINAHGKVTGMAIDEDQRLAMTTPAGMVVYDFVSGIWSVWNIPGAPAGKLAVYGGRFVTRYLQYTMIQGTGDADSINGVVGSIDWSVELAGISFATVRAFQRLWRLQVIGEWRGTHKLDVTISYPDDFPNDPTVLPELSPDVSTPYLYEAIPGHGKASQFGVLISVNHAGEVTPGASCALELLSAKVGIQAGQKQVPSGQRF